MIEIKAPVFPESIADGEVAEWHVKVGESVKRDQVIVDIETDKVVLEVAAPADGKVTEIVKQEGETVLAEEVLAHFEEGEVADEEPAAEKETTAPEESADESQAPAPATEEATAQETQEKEASAESGDAVASPAARKIASENKIELSSLQGSGKGGRITKEDVLKAVSDSPRSEPAPAARPAPAPEPAVPMPSTSSEERVERRVPMTRLRASIARRLVEAQQTAAMLTTFNEVDMKAIMDLRARYKDDFEKAHNGTRLGFMSFFVRASIESLKRFPAVNASIDGNDIVYHGYQDIGVAVSSPPRSCRSRPS